MLRVLCLGSFGIATLKLLGNALTAQRRPLLETGAVAVAFVTVFALDFALIPDHGGLGASIASAASYTLGGLAAAVIFGRTLGAGISDLIPRPSDVLVLGRKRERALQACRAGSRRVTAGGSLARLHRGQHRRRPRGPPRAGPAARASARTPAAPRSGSRSRSR